MTPAPALTVVWPYYQNPRMLLRQLMIMADEWSAEAKASLEVVIVDDGTPDRTADGQPGEAAVDVLNVFKGSLFHGADRLPALRVYRVLVDTPWHQHGARNLGASEARGRWLFMTDIDHVIPPDTLAEALRIARAEPVMDNVFTFTRVDAPFGEPWKADHASTMTRTRRPDGSLKPHVNSFLLPKALYWRVGGYDEDFCGVYGTDALFRRRLFAVQAPVELSFPLIRVGREVIPDASTVGLARKEDRVGPSKRDIAEAKRLRGDADKIKTLQFPWARVA